ncbi:MAG: SDR family oxidoreductase [Bacteroidetes bacterium]|nr:SDR family oxidoreductase [Bacteroidota bacterium]MBK7573149.1 SDR family oxidoreductase [Bacteroidota bacterium]
MKDKVIIITGASSGIGEALAKKFSSQGSTVVLAARQLDKLNVLKSSLEKNGAKVHAVACDVSNESQCKMLIDETIRMYGRIDVLINNAGISMRALFSELDLDVLRKVMDINFWGAVYCTKYAFLHLLKSKGSVVGISSIAGKKGLPGRAGYSASKFALEGFLETIRTENLKKDLHVLVACPGFTASNIRQSALAKDGSQQGESPRDEKDMMSADEVASHIYTAVVKRKRDLILTGNGKLTVFLNKFFPGFMDKMVYNHMAKEPNSPFK